MFLSSPITLNDGTTDHVYSYSNQVLGDPKALKGRWINDASSIISDEHLLLIHVTSNTSRERHIAVLSAQENVGTTEVEDWRTNVITTTIAHHPNASLAEVELLVIQQANLMLKAGFTEDMMRKQIAA